tara:strand:- start:517 stop:1194 length:678 start_codon:yes stop_codon:yes gene_type:complete
LGYFPDNNNSLCIYEAPKTGGSTLRGWIFFNYYNQELPLANKIYKKSNYYFYEPSIIDKIEAIGYRNESFFPFQEFTNICLVRPVVERFVSCYIDKIVYENNWRNLNLKSIYDIDAFIDIVENNFISHFKNPNNTDHRKKFLVYHFAPLTYHYGIDSSIYNEIFSTSNISSDYGLKGYLERIWKKKLPDIHARKQDPHTTINLNLYQKNRIEEIYSIDYDSGYFM